MIGGLRPVWWRFHGLTIAAFGRMTSKIVSDTLRGMKSVRSAIYIPADHVRAMAKASTLEADALIFDLEDGVSEAHKTQARAALSAHLATTRPQQRCVARVNHLSSAHFHDDMATICGLPIDALMLPKVAHRAHVDEVAAHLAQAGRADLPLWCNMETPMGYVHVSDIASHPLVEALVAGTNDLANDLRIVRTPCRSGLMHCLQALVLAGRAHGTLVLDGTFIDLNDDDGLTAEATQGKTLGFDGKTLIHPKQIEVVNRVFSPSEHEQEQAARIIAAYEAALAGGKGVTLLDGILIEKLHYDRAKALLEVCHTT